MIKLRNVLQVVRLSFLNVLTISLVVAPLSSATTSPVPHYNRCSFHEVMIL